MHASFAQPARGLSERELRCGDDYVTVIDTNLTKLERALGCA